MNDVQKIYKFDIGVVMGKRHEVQRAGARTLHGPGGGSDAGGCVEGVLFFIVLALLMPFIEKKVRG